MKLGCPTVRIGRAPHWNDPQVPAAMPDLPAAGAMAAARFRGRSFRNVGFVGFDIHSDQNPIQASLYEGMKGRATELGCTCHLWSITSGGGSASESEPEKYRRRQREFVAWVRDIPKPVGLFTFSDGFAATLCCMCEDAGLKVPEEVAILGLGNHELACVCAKPPLSSMGLDHTAQADAAARLLQQKMAGEAIERVSVKIPPLGIVARESTDTVGTLEPKVGAAVRYMWENLQHDLSVDDVARHVGVSRRTLSRHFHKELSRGVSAELTRKRLQELCRLLRETDVPILDLAPRVGFPSPEHLHRVFRREYGTSPCQYKLQQQGGRHSVMDCRTHGAAKRRRA